MEAKDTVMDMKQLRKVYNGVELKPVLEAQAELSFWAGRRAGHKDVVDWMKTKEQDDGVDSLYYFVVGKDTWDKKLKEWNYGRN